jgi:hypothetical protein
MDRVTNTIKQVSADSPRTYAWVWVVVAVLGAIGGVLQTVPAWTDVLAPGIIGTILVVGCSAGAAALGRSPLQ